MSNNRLIGLNKEFDKNKELYDELFISDSNYRLVSSSPKVFSAIHKDDFGDNFYISEEELDAYVEGFINGVTENVETLKKAVINENANNINTLESGMDDFDVKLSLYRSFKSLYDKWISNSVIGNGQTNGYFYNNYGRDENRMLYEHFKFINRAGQDVGKKAVIDFSYLSNLANTQNGQGPTQSLYESLTGVLSKNNFDFWPLPANIKITTDSLSDEDVKDIFRPLTIVKNIEAGPTFVCVYVGGSSRALADLKNNGSNCVNGKSNFEYNDDSFDITDPSDWPNEYNSNDKDSGVVVFKVRYGQEAQNHFSSLELDQTEFKETQESLQIIDAMTNPNSGSNPNKIGKGNNMYDVYLTRSYNCTVSGLGNMSIQPLMHFKLENVPMFRGTYLITGVKHTITPHNIVTDFTGMRQPKVTVPIVTEALSLLDIVLTETVSEGTSNQVNSNSSNYSNEDIAVFNDTDTNSKGCEIISRLKTDLGLTDVQAAGIVGNLIAESGLIADRIQGAGVKKGLLAEAGGGGYSWAQWTSSDRKQAFKDYASSKGLNLDNSPATDDVAYGFLIKEISESYSGFLKKLKQKNTVRDATVLTLTQYERPLDQGEGAQNTRTAFAENTLNSCSSKSSGGDGGSKPPQAKNCSSSVKFGLDGDGTLKNAKNVIVGSSSVGTLNGIKSGTNGTLVSNNIYVYYNCGGKTVDWLNTQIKADSNTYNTVTTFFQVGIGTNDGYKTGSNVTKKIKEYTNLVKKKFPNATLYVIPGTRGWGSVSNITKEEMKSYYKIYTDLGWTLLWPKDDSGNEIDPYFDNQTKAHDSSSQWFKKIMKKIKENKD